jgi:hypothetical protein
MSELRAMMFRLLMMSLALMTGLAFAQGVGPVSSADRGYDDGGLESHGVDANAMSDLSAAEANEDVARAAARGRESARSVVQDPGKASNKKAVTFKSAEAATNAFVEALRKDDRARLEAILVDPQLISSGDEVADRIDRERFLKEYDRKHSLGGREAGMVTLYVGESARPFAVPIVKGNDGYYFNSVAGARDLLFRRIGRNERHAIAVCSGFVAAQKEYALVEHDGQPPGSYAQKLMSDERKRNGLFWPARADELRSPLGRGLAAAEAKGYSTTTAGRSSPYHGYLYQNRTSQSRHARDGARKYIDGGGRQTGGFAMIAYPAEYGRTGVKTFIVNQDSIVYEKDLGPQTAEIARAMREFDPLGWRVAL